MIALNCLPFQGTWVHPRYLVGSCCSIVSFQFVLFLLVIVLFVFLQYTASDYHFSIFKPFLHIHIICKLCWSNCLYHNESVVGHSSIYGFWSVFLIIVHLSGEHHAFHIPPPPPPPPPRRSVYLLQVMRYIRVLPRVTVKCVNVSVRGTHWCRVRIESCVFDSSCICSLCPIRRDRIPHR